MRGACHRAALRADPLAPSGLQPLRRLLGGAFSLQHGRRRSIEFRGILRPRQSVFLCRHTRPAGLALACQFGSRRHHHHWRNQCHDVASRYGPCRGASPLDLGLDCQGRRECASQRLGAICAGRKRQPVARHCAVALASAAALSYRLPILDGSIFQRRWRWAAISHSLSD